MKNIIKSSVLFMFLLTVGGCNSWTDIEPKGTNMLQKVSDIEMLFNYKFTGSSFACEKAAILVNDMLMLDPNMTHVYKTITDPKINPLMTSYVAWDESIDRAEATETDNEYTTYYGIIGKICNPTLQRIDDAEGDRETAKRLKAEAYVLRAWYHYLIVNMYAKAYNPTTAATDGGVPYSKDTDLLSESKKKYTVQEVYDFLLEDIDAALALNALAAPSDNRMRVNSAFAHAVRAKILMSMHNYDEAYKAATASLAIENTIDDYNTMVGPGPKLNLMTGEAGLDYTLSKPEMSSKEDLFYAANAGLLMMGISPELSATVEPGNILFYHAGAMNGLPFYGVNITMFGDMFIYLNTGGLTTIEMYLTQAECLIRKSDINGAMDIINNIRSNRVARADIYPIMTGMMPLPTVIPSDYYYTPFTAASQAEAIKYLKQLYRTENWYGIRNFLTLKRWNTDDTWRETLTKHLDCLTETEFESFDFSLKPDSPLWIFPFPSKSMGLNENLTQNY